MGEIPAVSVVIPAYRHEAFVGEAIESVLGQTFGDFELIVIDDGSPDRTGEIADGYASRDSRIRVYHQANAGSHATINRGLGLARGEWVAILNSDDRFHPRRVERLLEAAGADRDFVLSDVRLIDEKGEPIADPAHWWNAMVEVFRERVRAEGALLGLLYGNYSVSTSNFFFRRTLWHAVGGLRNYRYVVDWEFALRAALHAPERFAYLIDEPLLDYRLHGANTILAGAMRGGAEISRMHRALLADHYGVPQALLASLHRNQRHVRRHWRELGEQRIERFVRDREADVAQLREALALESALVAALEAKVAALEFELARVYASRSWRYTRFLRRQ